jgi:hypothetical protein
VTVTGMAFMGTVFAYGCCEVGALAGLAAIPFVVALAHLLSVIIQSLRLAHFIGRIYATR